VSHADRRQQWGHAAHDRVGGRQVGVAVQPPDEQEIDDMRYSGRPYEWAGSGSRHRQQQCRAQSDQSTPEANDGGGSEFVVTAFDDGVPERVENRCKKDRRQYPRTHQALVYRA
jgi:hypothetical protein